MYLHIDCLDYYLLYKNRFYEVERHTRLTQIIPLLLKQFIFFAVILYAFIGFFKQPIISRLALGNYLIFAFIIICIFKFLTIYLLKKYQISFKRKY